MTDEQIFRTQAEILSKALQSANEQLERCGQLIFELRTKIKELEAEENPYFDKYDGVLPGDLGTDRP
jgi:phage shock protein A